jgi:geranylgeranyl pyrophosphate synthase
MPPGTPPAFDRSERVPAPPDPRPAPRDVAFVAEVKRRVDERLGQVLRAAEARAEAAGPEPVAIARALGELVRRGGKRLRPALALAAHRACGGDLESAVVDAGCA